MSSAIEVLKKDIISYEEIRKSGKKCLTTNNEECCFVHYPEIKEALLALEQKHNQVKWLISCLKTRLDLCKELREKDLDHYNKYIDIEIDFIYLSLERLGFNKSEIRKRVGEQK